MRTIILILALSMCITTSSQVGEAEVREEPIFVGSSGKKEYSLPKLVYHESEQGRYYMLTYQNLEYPTITDIRVVGFMADEEEIDYVYDFMKSGFDTDENRSLKLGNSTIRTFKSAKSIYVYVDHSDKPTGFFLLTAKQNDRLFGKAE